MTDLLDVESWGRRAPEYSSELERVLAIPRRQPPAEDSVDGRALVELMTRRLRRERSSPCACKRKCILRLNFAQAWALYEIGIARGLFGHLAVGSGKTALNFLAPLVAGARCAVVLVPPGLVEQLRAEYLLWREHWRVPSLLVGSSGWTVPGTPAVHVVTYSRLSSASATALLEEVAPDLVVADESHRIRHPDAARTARFLRYFAARPGTNFLSWSGSPVDKSVRDYGHLVALGLRERSPLPLDQDTLRAWSVVLDPPAKGVAPAPPGALRSLCRNGEGVREAFRARLQETRGVCVVPSSGVGASLYMHERDPGDLPRAVRAAIAGVRAAWLRPDGDELVEAYAVARCARELACGFYYRWVFPRGEPSDLVREWREARREWRREVRDELSKNAPHLDQPLLLARAAARAWREVPYDGDLPVWNSVTWPRWRAVRDQVKPETEAVWVDDFLVRDAVEWAKKERGVVWYEHRAFGAKLAEFGLVAHGGGPGAEQRILAENGRRSIAASIRAHGEGRDGLQFLFDRQLVANPPVSRETGGAGRWQQLLGRLHRPGQASGEVGTWIYRHTEEIRDAWDRARELAAYVTETIEGEQSFQKLLCATCTWETP